MKHPCTPIITCCAFWSAILALVMLYAVQASASDVPEYQVKAAMLYNVAKFVEWPAAPTDSSMQFCVYGKNPFGGALDSLRGKVVHGRKLNVRQISRIDEIGACQILFISSSERRYLPEILDRGELQGVLTISDLERFANIGGIVGFVEVDGKIKLEVNLEAAQKAKIKISSQLLKLVRIVRESDK